MPKSVTPQTPRRATEIPVCHCMRCHHSWVPRSEYEPAHCPNRHCHSPRWNRRYIRPPGPNAAKSILACDQCRPLYPELLPARERRTLTKKPRPAPRARSKTPPHAPAKARAKFVRPPADLTEGYEFIGDPKRPKKPK